MRLADRAARPGGRRLCGQGETTGRAFKGILPGPAGRVAGSVEVGGPGSGSLGGRGETGLRLSGGARAEEACGNTFPGQGWAVCAESERCGGAGLWKCTFG